MYTGDFAYLDATPYYDSSGVISEKWNSIAGYWWVPSAPNKPANTNRLSLWIGFQSDAGIIQPELWWDYSSNSWQIDVQYGYGNSWVNIEGGTWPTVYSGDQIYGTAFLYSVSDDYETWQAYVYDETAGHGAGGFLSMDVTIPYGTFFTGPNSGNLAILETQGQLACSGLPASGGEDFEITELTQEDVYNPEVYNNVLGLISAPVGGTNKGGSWPQAGCASNPTWNTPTTDWAQILWAISP